MELNRAQSDHFFKFETDPHVYLLTSAHVLLGPEQMQKLIKDNNVYYVICGTDACQPPESISVEQSERHHLGRTELALYKKGGENKAGMEIALVRIDENRIPIDGTFPDTTSFHSREFGTLNPFVFPSEKICEVSSLLKSTEVYKYGAVSGLTKGRVRAQDASVRTRTLWYHNLGFEMTLYEQTEIDSVDGISFGEIGDSGSVVLQKGDSELTAVGIFEGKIDDTYLVTPIVDIKQALCETLSLYREPPSDTVMDVEEHHSSMAIKLFYVPFNNNISQTNANTVNRESNETITRQTAAEMKTNILQHTEHKIGTIKAELTAVKLHVDNTKTEIKQDMNQMENRIIGNINNQMEALRELLINQRTSGHMSGNT